MIEIIKSTLGSNIAFKNYIPNHNNYLNFYFIFKNIIINLIILMKIL